MTFKIGQHVRVATVLPDGTVDWSALATVKRIPKAWAMDGYVPVIFDDSPRGSIGLMVPREQIMASNV